MRSSDEPQTTQGDPARSTPHTASRKGGAHPWIPSYVPYSSCHSQQGGAWREEVGGAGVLEKSMGGRHGSGEGWAGGSGWTTGHSCCNSPHFLSHGSGAGSLKSRRWAGPAPFRGSRRECCLCPRSSCCLLPPWCSWAPATWPSSPCVFTSFSLCAPVSPSYQDTVLLVQGPP